MTKTDDAKKFGDEAEITITNAVPASDPAFIAAQPSGYGSGAAPGEPPIPPGHQRFYCSTCRTVSYPSPIDWQECKDKISRSGSLTYSQLDCDSPTTYPIVRLPGDVPTATRLIV